MIPIIIVPCIPTRVRYWPGREHLVVRPQELDRISIAFRPPMKKKRPMPHRYWMPTTL